MRIGLGIGTTIGRAGGGAPPSEPGMLTGRLAHYLDGSTPYHSGPTANKYSVRDVSGNGNHALVKTPCLTSVANASNYCSIGLFELSADFEIAWWMKYEGSNTTANGCMPVGGGLSGGGSTFRAYIWYRPSTNTWTIAANGEAVRLTVVNSTIGDNQWHHIKVTRVGTTYKLFIDGTEVGSSTGAATLFSIRSILMTYTSGYALHGQLADFRITNGSLTTQFPLQEGNGRDVAWYANDGTYGVIDDALVNGVVADLWSAKCPGFAPDWSMENGGRIGAEGGFILGVPGSGLAADGNAKTFAPGKLGNPFSSFNLNSNWSQSLRDRSLPTEYKKGQNINGQVIPAESAFRRSSADGDDRIILYTAAKSGGALDEVRTHTGETAQPTWTIAELPDDTADEYFAQIAANSGTISAGNQTAVRNLLQGLDDDGLYAKVLALYLFHGNHLNAARLNAINPGTHSGAWNIVWVGTPTLNASGGITPSSGNYGKAFHPDSMGLSLRSGAGLGFYSTSNAASSEKTMGIETYFHLSPKDSGNAKFSVGGYERTGAAQDLSGFHFASREPDSNIQAAYRNGTQYFSDSSGAFPNLGYVTTPELGLVGARRGASLNVSTTPIRLSIVTTGLLSAEVAALDALIQTYISELV